MTRINFEVHNFLGINSKKDFFRTVLFNLLKHDGWSQDHEIFRSHNATEIAVHLLSFPEYMVPCQSAIITIGCALVYYKLGLDHPAQKVDLHSEVDHILAALPARVVSPKTVWNFFTTSNPQTPSDMLPFCKQCINFE